MLHRFGTFRQGTPAVWVWAVAGVAVADVSQATVSVFSGTDQAPAAVMSAVVAPVTDGVSVTCTLSGSDTAFLPSGRLTARLALALPDGTRTQDAAVALWPSTWAAPVGEVLTPMGGHGSGWLAGAPLRLSLPVVISRLGVRVSHNSLQPEGDAAMVALRVGAQIRVSRSGVRVSQQAVLV